MRAFNALCATLTTLLLATVIVLSAGSFVGSPAGTKAAMVRALGSEPTVPRLVLEKPAPLGASLATITPCLEAPQPLAQRQ